MLEEQQISSATVTPQTGNRFNQVSSQSYKIITQYGDMLVIKQGIQFQPQQSDSQQQQSQQRPIIMTFHDLGLNSELQFATFCECEEVKLMLKTFTMIHVNFIGQEFPSQQQQQDSPSKSKSTPTTASSNLPEDFKYPNMEQMAESIVDICAQLRIRSFIAIAVGAGAHIVGNLALLRPDLVDGLFLINPVITSCSITEWLYFKMSAIASNHSISSWSGGGGGGSSSKDRSLPSFSSSSSNTASPSTSNHKDTNKNLQSSPSNSSGQHKSHHHSHGIGFKKLLHSAAHLHFPHPHLLHHHHSKHQRENSNKQKEDENDSIRSFDSKQSSPENRLIKCDSEAKIEPEVENDSKSISTKLESSVYVSKPPISKPHSGSRLRQLIFSRNIRNTTGYQQQQHEGSNLSRTSSASAESQIMNNEQESEEVTIKNKNKQHKVKSSDSNESIERGGGGKKPPTEYLMYHHFGPVSFQTYRRSSDTPLVRPSHNRDSPTNETQERPQSGGNLEETTTTTSSETTHSGATSSDGTCSSIQSSGQNSPATPGGRSRTSSSKRGVGGNQISSNFSNREPRPATGKCRSGSVCMDSIYLSSFENDRQKSSYVQSVYKHYFHQINSHNLWLFAQSFAKRRSLNLRKDCGAAAHAAAAAATLGTSICSAFVGITPGPSLSATTSSSHRVSASTSSSTAGAGATLNKPASDTSSSTTSKRQQVEIKANDTKVDNSLEQLDGKSSSKPNITLSDKQTTTTTTTTAEGIGLKYATSIGTTSSTSFVSSQQSKQNSQQPKALVAGTKVKRTFTCQTLIMCSSIQMHRERAFKLMSLLNPLQATWIQTDHLLVLEEKPEKVCQALRLFLQGIGYSMSTYERRIRLSSTTGSAGSADSNNSAPSISEKQHY